jgi:hypothetical protein
MPERISMMKAHEDEDPPRSFISQLFPNTNPDTIGVRSFIKRISI